MVPVSVVAGARLLLDQNSSRRLVPLLADVFPGSAH
jgi:hypothetical protein